MVNSTLKITNRAVLVLLAVLLLVLVISYLPISSSIGDNTSAKKSLELQLKETGKISNFIQDSKKTQLLEDKSDEGNKSAGLKTSLKSDDKPKNVMRDIVGKNKGKLNTETEIFLANADAKDEGQQKEFIVKFAAGIDRSKLSKVTVLESVEKFNIVKIKGKPEDVGKLLNNPEIRLVELEQTTKTLEETVPLNIRKTKADNVWNLTKGLGVKVAMLDTGIASHSDLNVAGGYSVVSNDFEDKDGHGTAVAGVVSSLMNDEGLVGVAPEIDLYAVKIMESSSGELSDAIAGLDWAIKNRTDIVSMSFGFESYSQIFKEVVEEAYNNGILLVAASGNNGKDNILYPARYDKVIAVGAVDENDTRAPFSSYGFDMELVAPGVSINSTSLDGEYASFSGTSMSAPHVAGVAALIKAYNMSLTNVEIRNKLRNDALELGNSGWDFLYGYGLVQANLDTFNFTPHNDSYFYQIYNVTGYNTFSEQNVFWIESYEPLDNIHFDPGIYLVNITKFDFTKKYYYNVTENGSIFILDALTIIAYDNFSGDGTDFDDAVTWVGGELKFKLDGYYPTYIDGECFEDHWDGNFHWPFDYCFFRENKKSACDADFSVIDCGVGQCYSNSQMQSYHPFVDTSYAYSSEVFSNYFVHCGYSNKDKDGPQNTKQYWVIDKKRGKCLNESDYTIEGHYGSGNWRQLTPIRTCQQDTVCTDTIEYTSHSAYIDPCKYKCRIPDGSSWDCDCNSDTDCPGDSFCNQVSGPDACVKKQYSHECPAEGQYFCEGSKVVKCVVENSYRKKQAISTCSGKYEYCDENAVNSLKSCSKLANLDVWLDYADTGVAVNKQPGDKLKLNIFSNVSATVSIAYNNSIFDGDCSASQFVSHGINTCNITVNADIGNSTEEIRVENRIVGINIFNNPEFLVMTDSEKLLQQFSNEVNGVKSVLKQAYVNAKDKGVVYDLSWYKEELGVNNPFASFFRYNEKIAKPSVTDNSYSIAVSNFIKEKCENCKDVMIVGDDFVVPGYRRDIPTLEKNWFFWTEKDIKTIYTDIPYVSKKTIPFSNYYEMFKKDGKYQGKDVLFILPNSITEKQRMQIERLKKAFDDKNYSPDYAEWTSQDVFCVDERWFSKVRGQTLIIVGTEENNNAFKCMPFVAGNVNRDTAFMQPNVWDNKEYALVINTNNPEVIGVLANLVETGEIAKLKSESAYFFKVGVTYASYAALGVGVGSMILFSGGSAAPAAIIAASQVLEFISDSGDVVDTCVVNSESIGWCGGTIGMAALPFVPSKVAKAPLKKLADSELNQKLFKMFEPVDDLISKYFKKLRSSKAIGDEAFEAVTKTTHDNVYMAKGANKLFGGSDDVDNLVKQKIRFESDVPQKIRQYQRATYIKSIGKIDDGLERMQDAALRNKLNDKSKKLIDAVETDNNLANSKGFRGEIESLSNENLDNLEDISREFTDAEKQFIGGGGQIDILRKNGDIVETKFVKINNLASDDTVKQINGFVRFQEYHGKQSAQIVLREKTDLAIKSQSELSIVIPEDVKSILNGFQETSPNKVHLEIIDLEGNLWRFS